jgi:hypothetical protein
VAAHDIERIHWPSVDVFTREYVEAGKPVILTGGLGGCRAGSWTPDYLCSVIGHKRVKVAVSADGSPFTFTTEGKTFDSEEMTFADVIARMQASSETKYYIMQIPVREDLPELAPDIRVPAAIDATDLRALNFWLGGANNLTPVHFDYSNNLLAQVHGIKEITLFAPDQSDCMYPLPLGRHGHVSQVNLWQPDANSFPLFSTAAGLQFTLEPGDVLFIPAFWWHAVKSRTMSISLNFWWKLYPSQVFVPIIVERLVPMFDRALLMRLAIVGRGLIDAAVEALSRPNLLWAASLLAVAALDEHWRSLLADTDAAIGAKPIELDVLNAHVAAQGHGRAADSRDVASWMATVNAARAAEDSGLAREVVTHMVEDIRQLLAAPGVPSLSAGRS